METRKLYYEDCHTRRFTAAVTGCQEEAGGWAVTLDATAFYPEGGGQPCDLGTLGGVTVLDVRERDGELVHLCGGPLETGSRVEGEIDYPRRFGFMQQHAGEHIVSGIISRRFGLHNVGFHMGADVVTIDFDGELSPAALAEVEREANEKVWEDLPIRCWFPDGEALRALPYRSKRALTPPVRIVEIPGVDICACCGVHVARTGEIGLVKLFSVVKFRGGARVEMACGGQALALLNTAYQQNRLVSQAFSARLPETGAAAQRMNEALAAEKFRAAGLERRLFACIAGQYAGHGLALHFEEALDGGALRALTEQIAAAAGGAAVFSGTDGAYSMCLAGENAPALGKALTAALGGRGGGRDGFFQGRVSASREAIRAFFAAQAVPLSTPPKKNGK